MTTYELLKMNQSMLQVLVDNSINIRDIQCLQVYEEFCKLKEQNLKVAYIIQHLADIHHCTSRTIYNIVNRMNTKLNI